MYKPHIFSKNSSQKSGMRLIYGKIRGWTSSYVMPILLSTFQSLATKHSCVLFQLPSNFNFMGHFEVVIFKKIITSGEHLTFFIVFSKEKGNTGKISLSKNSIVVKACNKHCVRVLKLYLFVLACLLVKLHWNLIVCCLYFFFFFSKFGLPN